MSAGVFLLCFCVLKFIHFAWRIISLKYSDFFFFARHHCELAVGTRVPSILNPTRASLVSLSLQVFTDHRLCMPCSTHYPAAGMYCTDSIVCFSAALMHDPSLASWTESRSLCLLPVCVSFAALYVGSLVLSLRIPCMLYYTVCLSLSDLLNSV